jgi:hypothetical protein
MLIQQWPLGAIPAECPQSRYASARRSKRTSPHDWRLPQTLTHQAIVFAALAVIRLVEDRPGWSNREFRQDRRALSHVEIHAGNSSIPRKPLPVNLLDALAETYRTEFRTSNNWTENERDSFHLGAALLEGRQAAVGIVVSA